MIISLVGDWETLGHEVNVLSYLQRGDVTSTMILQDEHNLNMLSVLKSQAVVVAKPTTGTVNYRVKTDILRNLETRGSWYAFC